jgi:osmotically-inducible protein OsmY
VKNNETLQRDVQDAIKWEPLLHAAEIGVTVQDGVITLTGVVDNYAKKLEAETAAKNVVGVKAVIEKITIKSDSLNKSDNEIATEVLKALEENWQLPGQLINVKVENGVVTLGGELNWNYQKEVAKKVISSLGGVIGVVNNISIKPETHNEIEKKAVELALERNWAIHNLNIKVNVVGTKVILSGTVNSLYQKEEAGKIAWNVPGVWIVDNELVLDYNYSLSI